MLPRVFGANAQVNAAVGPRRALRLGMLLASACGALACSGGDAPVVAADAAIDDAPIDGALTDAAIVDAAAIDGALTDAAPVDVPDSDASTVGVTAPVAIFGISPGTTQTSFSVGPMVALERPDAIALSGTLSGALGVIWCDIGLVTRTELRWDVATFNTQLCQAQRDHGDRVFALTRNDPAMPLARDSQLISIDVVTGDRVTQPLPGAPGGTAWPVLARRDVGGGATVVAPDQYWRLDATGALVASGRFGAFGPRVFVPGTSTVVGAAGTPGAPLTRRYDLALGNTTDTTAPIAWPTYLAGDRVWTVRDAGTTTIVAPLDGQAPTVVPIDAAVAAVDVSGRITVVGVDGTAGSLVAMRIDPARFDGTDGATRIDPTFGTAGVARLRANPPGFAAISGDGGLALWSPSATPGSGSAITWFDLR